MKTNSRQVEHDKNATNGEKRSSFEWTWYDSGRCGTCGKLITIRGRKTGARC